MPVTDSLKSMVKAVAAPMTAGAIESMVSNRAEVGLVGWNEAGTLGQGVLRWLGQDWEMYDFQASLEIDHELADQLANPPEDPARPQREHRQCLLLHVAAGLLWSARGHLPTPSAVQEAALQLRREMFRYAVVAANALGEPPAMMNQAESDLRTFVHDLVHRDHDKDYRCLAAFPPTSAKHAACHILRVSHRGACSGESVYGWHFDDQTSPHVWLLVHRGHMRLLIPPGNTLAERLQRAPETSLGFAELYAAGWEAHLLAGSTEPETITAKHLFGCPRCPDPGAP